jgi:predicted kinase
LRILTLFRGAPACGKSTFIKNNNLEQYALSADNIRLLLQSPIMTTNGSYNISQKNDKKVWELLFDILEQRMIRGEFVVVDATNSKTVELNRYKSMAETYRYRIICIDMTSVPIEICKERNKNRKPDYKVVPDHAIDNMYARFETQKIPSGIKAIKPEEFWDIVSYLPLDFSEYKKIHHIGDLHGCNTVLQEYLWNELKEDELHIFIGDYIDRGIENVKLLNYIFSIMDKPNVIFLQGNHEQWLWNYSNDMPSKSKEFEQVTKRELNKSQIDKKKLRIFYRKLRQLVYYTYNNKVIVVSHGGISTMPERFEFLATEQLIKGVGEYKDMEVINTQFLNSTPINYYQIHGHRNVSDSPIQINERCYCLEGSVEFGGHLRIVTLDGDGFETVEVKNNIFRTKEDVKPIISEKIEVSNMELISKLRENRYIRESKFNHVSSFNFTKDAFYKKIWDDQTMKARGLFLNTENGEVIIKSYLKFFNINERENTKLDNLKNVFQFPVTAWVKYNGFLGLVGYDSSRDELLVSSKSNPHSEFAGYFKDIFNNTLTEKQQIEIKEYLKEQKSTLIFESIDPTNDPHMIKYNFPHLVLLEIMENNIDEPKKKSYEELQLFSNKYNLPLKVKAKVLNDWREFYQWHEEVNVDDYKYKNEYIEGFVLEDNVGFMTKIKLQYYNFWKHMRSVKEDVCRSGFTKYTSSLTTPLANEFYGWLRQQTKDVLRKDIITLREMFYSEKGE